MDEPIMPEPITQPTPEPKPSVRQVVDERPDGTRVELEIHHNAPEL
jgi:hypothetical protein